MLANELINSMTIIVSIISIAVLLLVFGLSGEALYYLYSHPPFTHLLNQFSERARE
jgi:hypothetical protein